MASTTRHSLLDTNALLLDTWLLITELRQNGALLHSENLWQHCTGKIEQARRRMLGAGLSQRAVELIGYALCVLIDECVLACADAPAHANWASKPLQAHFFKRHEGGVQVYQDIRAELAQPTPDLHVLTCLQRVLLLGFRGCYGLDPAPERERLLTLLSERVAALPSPEAGMLRVPSGLRGWHGWSALPTHALGGGLVLASLWWALHSQLGAVIRRLAGLEP